MGWSTTSDLDQFAAAAGSYLRSRAAENTLLLSAAQDARNQVGNQKEAGLLFGWWAPPDGGDPRGAFVHDPAVPLLISGRAPEMAAALAGPLVRLGRPVRGVDAPTEAADAFAAAWSQRAGTAVRAHRTCRVYRLTAQSAAAPGTPPLGTPAAPGAWPPPEPPVPPGRLRVAVPEDRSMLADWLRAAAIEAAERLTSPTDLADDLISYGGAIFWEVLQKSSRFRDAAHYLAIPHHRDLAQFGEPVPQPVALATITRPVAGTVRIDMLYTLPERRRNGYAAALTQAVSRTLLWGAVSASTVSASTVSASTVSASTGPASPLRASALPGLLTHGCVREVVMITDKNRPDRWGGRFGFQLVGERAVLRFGPATGSLPRAGAATKPMPRLPTGPLPRLPRLRG